MNLKKLFLSIVSLSLILFSSIILDGLIKDSFADENKEQVQTERLEAFETVYNQGAFNRNLFKNLAKNSVEPQKRLAFARQAMVLDPQDPEIRSIIEKTKQELVTNKSPSSLDQRTSWLDFVALKSYVPFYVEDYLLILFSILISFLVFSSKIPRFAAISIWLIFLYLFCNKVFVTYSRDGSLRTIKSASEVLKTEGIALNEFKTYSSQDVTSQVTMVISPGDELDIFKLDPELNEWIKLRSENSRFGWVKYTPENLFVIKR